MMARARHDVLIVADSDTYVEDGYLATVTAPLLDERIGLVTCVYRDVPTATLWSRLGAMYINEWYMPSVLLARLFGHRSYASGQTLCLRRRTLETIGGFEVLADHLADDYRLGQLIRSLGQEILLSPVQVMAKHHEPDLESLARHELRWMHTIRVLRPRSFSWLFLSFSLPLALLGFCLSVGFPGYESLASALFLGVIAARIGLQLVHRLRARQSPLAQLWLIPACDLLILWVWIRSFFTTRVSWRGNDFDVDADGVMRRAS